jgi:hypothetical protein
MQQCTRAAEIRPLEVGIVAVVFSAADGGGCMMLAVRYDAVHWAPPCDTRMLCCAARPTGCCGTSAKAAVCLASFSLTCAKSSVELNMSLSCSTFLGHLRCVACCIPRVLCMPHATRMLYAACACPVYVVRPRVSCMPRVCCMLYVHVYLACPVYVVCFTSTCILHAMCMLYVVRPRVSCMPCVCCM